MSVRRKRTDVVVEGVLLERRRFRYECGWILDNREAQCPSRRSEKSVIARSVSTGSRISRSCFVSWSVR